MERESNLGRIVAVVTMVLALAACPNPDSDDQVTDTTEASTVPTTATRASTTTVLRLGCGAYCRNAGGYGNGSEATPIVEIVTSGTVLVAADGTVPITVRCLIPVPCRGALVMDFTNVPGEGARSDLDVPAAGTVALGLQLTSNDVQVVRAQRRVEVVVTADTGLVPPCVGTTRPGALCQTFSATTAAPGRRLPDDGLERVTGKILTLSAS